MHASLDLEDDVDGAGEVGSREPRGSAELEIDMIEQLTNFTALILLYVHRGRAGASGDEDGAEEACWRRRLVSLSLRSPTARECEV